MVCRWYVQTAPNIFTQIFTIIGLRECTGHSEEVVVVLLVLKSSCVEDSNSEEEQKEEAGAEGYCFHHSKKYRDPGSQFRMVCRWHVQTAPNIFA